MCRNEHNLMLAAAVVVLVATQAGCQKEDALPKVQGRYSDTERKFSIQFPQGWGIDRRKDGALLGVVSGRQDSDDEFSENITLEVWKLSKPKTIDAFAAEVLVGWRKGATDFEEHENAVTTIGEAQARRIVHSQTVQGMRLKIVAYVLVRDDSAFLIKCTAQPGRFDAYRKTFEECVASFRLE